MTRAIQIGKRVKEVVFDTKDVNGNKHILHFKNKGDGFVLNGGERASYRNWCIPVDALTLEWAADEGKWEEILAYINQGSEKVSNVRSR